jgi:type III restriction enzyme
MLKEAVELQQNAVKKLVDLTNVKDEITFKAPTGSGKTFMMADFMNRILSNNKDVVFLVSTLSKGNLADQNNKKFISYKESGKFQTINPYLINTDVSGEESLFIPTTYNVYVLPRDLYKNGGKLMQGAMSNFLQNMTITKFLGGKEKKIWLIKDECHDATNNLDSLSQGFFSKIINFSATPNLKRGQLPDVEIKDDDAVNCKLIKHIEIGDDDDTVEDAICKFENIKEEYRNKLGINPCLIIQISNKDKSDEEIRNIIMPILNKDEHQDLKWMLIVNEENKCDTNDQIKAKQIPVKKWKEYAKENMATIDIIIFKMVISEGWDIPRACMLYQVRNTQSDQLDEQIMGRVRRNPRLLDFEKLDLEAQNLATTSWIWGILPKESKKIRNVKLFGTVNDISNEVKIKTTRIKQLTNKTGFNLNSFVKNETSSSNYSDIFTLYKKLQNSDYDIQQLCYDYSDNFQKWWDFNDIIDKIIIENNKYACDYEESMEITIDDNGKEQLSSFPYNSSYVDNGNYENIGDWVWKRIDNSDKFSFDSDAERQWADKLKELSFLHTSSNEEIIKTVLTGQENPNKNMINLFTGYEPQKINPIKKYLWGKNYISNSDIKFDYYLNGIHSSYPDFIMIDLFDRINIFEVKSVNKSANSNIDETEYKNKIEELKRCYKQASKLTGNIFYLPVLKNEEWQITQLLNGNEKIMTYEQFFLFMITSPINI